MKLGSGATAALSVFLAAAQLHAQPPGRWQLASELRIGQDGRSGYDFSRIAAVLPARDGSVVIADSRNNEIVVFGRSGEHLRNVGGRGRGPGEYGRLRGTGLLADTLWVIDGAERRVSLFSLDGKTLATIRLEGEAFTASRWIPFLTALLPDDRGLGFGSPSMSSGLAFRGSPEPVLLMSRSARVLDTLTWVSIRNRYLVFTRPDGTPPGIVSLDGSLWLRREEGKPTVDYWVITKDGNLLSTVTVPANVTLRAASSTQVWAEVKDEFDVPTVVRYQIPR